MEEKFGAQKFGHLCFKYVCKRMMTVTPIFVFVEKCSLLLITSVLFSHLTISLPLGPYENPG